MVKGRRVGTCQRSYTKRVGVIRGFTRVVEFRVMPYPKGDSHAHRLYQRGEFRDVRWPMMPAY